MTHSTMTATPSAALRAGTLERRQYRILVTGSRDWPDTEAARNAIRSALIEAAETLTSPTPDGTWPTITVVHGAARGFDWIAAGIASELGMTPEDHPVREVDYGRWGRSGAPTRRNREMVDLGADACVAGPIGDGWSGTRHAMKLATAAGIPLTEVQVP